VGVEFLRQEHDQRSIPESTRHERAECGVLELDPENQETTTAMAIQTSEKRLMPLYMLRTRLVSRVKMIKAKHAVASYEKNASMIV